MQRNAYPLRGLFYTQECLPPEQRWRGLLHAHDCFPTEQRWRELLQLVECIEVPPVDRTPARITVCGWTLARIPGCGCADEDPSENP